jgi:hypothetical protein
LGGIERRWTREGEAEEEDRERGRRYEDATEGEGTRCELLRFSGVVDDKLDVEEEEEEEEWECDGMVGVSGGGPTV